MSWSYDDWDHSGDLCRDFRHDRKCCPSFDHYDHCRRRRRFDLDCYCKFVCVCRRRRFIPIGRVTIDCTPVTFDSRKHHKHCW